MIKERELPTIDVVDVKTKLKNEFPHVEFIVDEEERKHPIIGTDTYHVFKLKKLLGHTFEQPVKTSISIKKDAYITEKEFQGIKKMMWESFNKFKLLGIA